MYHIELVDRDGSRVLRRTSMRSLSVDLVRERALRLFRRAQAPGSNTRDPGGVRVVDGASYEVFSAMAHD